jgi:chromatin structure-remodeling complex subunit RSC1/2
MLQPQLTRPSPTLTPNPYQHQTISPAPQYGRQTIQQLQASYRANIAPSTPASQQHHPYTPHQTIHPQSSLTPSHATNLAASATPSLSQPFSRPLYQQQANTATTTQTYAAYPSTTPASQNNPYADQRHIEVFTLSDTANASIPAHIRDHLPQDDSGRVIFFTKPPVVHDFTVRGKEGTVLRHSEKYLKAKEERIATKRAMEGGAKADSAKRVKA